MPDIFKWMKPYKRMEANTFAQGFWNLIQRDPTVITVNRNGVTLASQTVRVVYSNTERESNAPTSGTNVRQRDIVVYGVKDHPDPDVDDTNLRVGDMFSLDGRLFRITDVILNPGQLEAEGVAIS